MCPCERWANKRVKIVQMWNHNVGSGGRCLIIMIMRHSSIFYLSTIASPFFSSSSPSYLFVVFSFLLSVRFYFLIPFTCCPIGLRDQQFCVYARAPQSPRHFERENQQAANNIIGASLCLSRRSLHISIIIYLKRNESLQVNSIYLSFVSVFYAFCLPWFFSKSDICDYLASLG